MNTHQNTLRRVPAALLAAFALGVAGAQARAQQGVTVPNRPAAAPTRTTPQPVTTADPSPIELADDPFRLESVGLTMYLPAGTTVQSDRIGDRQSVQVLPEEKSRTWILNIQTPKTSNPKATIKESADQTIALLQGSVGVTDPQQTRVLSTEAEILDRAENLTLDAGPCERFYIATPPPPGSTNAPRIVKGYTIFKPSDTQFVVFELITTEPAFRKARQAYETCLATAKFTDPAQLAASRSAAVKTGAAFLAGLTPEDYRAVCDGKERWYRLFRPSAGGSPRDAEEIGYRGVRFWAGKRGELDIRKNPGSFSREDQQEGFLARLKIRIIDGERFIDTYATYFMSPDRKEEAWSLQMTQRDRNGKDLAKWTEIGARNNNDMTVSVEQSGQPARIVKPFLQGEAYLSQFEAYSLPQLLIRSKASADFGFYTYRSATETISLRRDTLARSPANAGAWAITTEFRDDAMPLETVYTEQGEMIRSSLGEGRIAKPINPEELFELWRSKGLPTDTSGR
ncbi:MAG: hypothetical protein KF745_13240 [Phycisphaeraceae bacterium]|nr:hypothetical protein [Phycisphaeraceae bacterium]